jgi:hypothetical protein
VSEGGQAIVGNVGGGMRTKSEKQSVQLHAPGREMRSANMEREALPVAGNANGRCRMHGGSIQGQSECVQARRNTAEAIARRREIFGRDPLCSRPRGKRATLDGKPGGGWTGSLPTEVQRFSANHSRAEKPMALLQPVLEKRGSVGTNR